jgi:hypothetical protein
MKVTGIELLQMISDKKIKKGTKIYLDYAKTFNRKRYSGEIEYLTFDGNDLYVNDSFQKVWNCLFITCIIEQYFEIEIIEEPKEEFEEIEKIGFIYNNTYGNRSQHKKSEEPLINAINELIENQNKIIRELKANKKTIKTQRFDREVKDE